MDALLTSLSVLVIVMAGAVAGSIVGRRLPEHHLSDASKDIVKFGAGFIATMAALVLGLLVASAKSSYDAKAAEVQQGAARVIVLDQMLRQYGPDAKASREVLRAVLVARHGMTWATNEALAAGKETMSGRGTPPGADVVRASIAALVPTNDNQRALQLRSLQAIDDFMQIRWLFVAQSTDSVSIPLLAVLVIWLTTIAFCTGLYAPRNGTVAVVAFLAAFSLSGAIFLIVEMYQPFTGFLRISDAPLRTAMAYLDQ